MIDSNLAHFVPTFTSCRVDACVRLLDYYLSKYLSPAQPVHPDPVGPMAFGFAPPIGCCWLAFDLSTPHTLSVP